MAFSGASASGADFDRLTVSVDPIAMDLLSAALSDLAPAGWSERFGDPAGPAADVWVPAGDAAAVDRLRNGLAAWGIAARIEVRLETNDWREALRRHHQPITVGGLVRVRPPWVDAEAGLIDIVIDPAMAFGTGQHATTRGCLELLIDLEAGSVVDVGCGSGVLAIAAAKLGHAPVRAIDTDPLAIEATTANAAINGVDLQVELGAGETGELPVAQTLLANITAPTLLALAEALPESPPTVAILSGIRPYDVERVAGAWREVGYRLDERIDGDDWSAIRLVHT